MVLTSKSQIARKLLGKLFKKVLNLQVSDTRGPRDSFRNSRVKQFALSEPTKEKALAAKKKATKAKKKATAKKKAAPKKAVAKKKAAPKKAAPKK